VALFSTPTSLAPESLHRRLQGAPALEKKRHKRAHAGAPVCRGCVLLVAGDSTIVAQVRYAWLLSRQTPAAAQHPVTW
jgi:hypothetical protein